MKKLLLLALLAICYYTSKSQNVGIGIPAPTQKLDVSGNVKYSGAIMPGGAAGTTGQMLLSGGGATNTWGPAYLTPANTTTGIGKFYVSGVDINANTNLQLTVTDPNCTTGSYVGVCIAGLLSGTIAQQAKVSIPFVQTGNGQFVVYILNSNLGVGWTNVTLAIWSVY